MKPHEGQSLDLQVRGNLWIMGQIKPIYQLKNEKINKIGLQYINRLSDYFFVIACLVNLKLGVNETVYKKSKKIFKAKD